MPAPHPHPGWPVGISPRARVSPPSWWAPEITDLESGCQMALLSLPASKPQACPGGSWEEKHLKEGPPRRASHPHYWSLGFWRASSGSEASTPGEGPSAAAVFPSGKVTEPGPVYSAAQGLSE